MTAHPGDPTTPRAYWPGAICRWAIGLVAVTILYVLRHC